MDSFTYYDENGPADSNTATVYITVYSTPVAIDDYYTDAENQTLTVSVPKLYACCWSDNNADGGTEYAALYNVPNVDNFGWGNDEGNGGPLDSYNVEELYYVLGTTVIEVWNTTPAPSAFSEAANLGVTILVSNDLTTLRQESDRACFASRAGCAGQ